ncbi:MAG: hypothetical protein BIP78_1550 [Candidatus Bipolaricaulis sibiricus]|uniref:Uncharacterized protein n=1 Tax=Bipolaricaulis sibiricus TaxID=2501609 RepID=A0A410FW77_BIPS1|nr:MAG: hypothetical protein BIP78_1550 [Candidatus Bipolaricaulis sibiricus]
MSRAALRDGKRTKAKERDNAARRVRWGRREGRGGIGAPLRMDLGVVVAAVALGSVLSSAQCRPRWDVTVSPWHPVADVPFTAVLTGVWCNGCTPRSPVVPVPIGQEDEMFFPAVMEREL